MQSKINFYSFIFVLIITSGFVVYSMSYILYCNTYDFDTGCPLNQTIPCIQFQCQRIILIRGSKHDLPMCTKLICYNEKWLNCISMGTSFTIFILCILLCSILFTSIGYLCFQACCLMNYRHKNIKLSV
jgi:hypothetical protein